jgi:RNA polymerase sigma-70 factor (ECF subfamily)
LSRAKEKLRQQPAAWIELDSDQVRERLDAVLSTIYLIFNEGYATTQGESPIRRDLCEEAIRLAKMLAAHPACNSPSAEALVALLLLHAARFDGRQGPDGSIVLLAHQDRQQWNSDWLREAMTYAARAARGTELSRYHLESAIAWEHCRAPNFESTDWRRIADYYQLLCQQHTSPMIQLNAAVAVSYAESVQRGKELLLQISDSDRRRLRPWWDCCLAQIHERLGRWDIAQSHWRDALALAASPSQRQFIHRQLERTPPNDSK